MMRSQKVTINNLNKITNFRLFHLPTLYRVLTVFVMCGISADIISCVEFNHDGDLLATGDKGGRVVIFQRDPVVSFTLIFVSFHLNSLFIPFVSCSPKLQYLDEENTMSTVLSRVMNLSLITSSRWRLKKRSTKSGG